MAPLLQCLDFIQPAEIPRCQRAELESLARRGAHGQPERVSALSIQPNSAMLRLRGACGRVIVLIKEVTAGGERPLQPCSQCCHQRALCPFGSWVCSFIVGRFAFPFITRALDPLCLFPGRGFALLGGPGCLLLL